jgi:hypothetical protein
LFAGGQSTTKHNGERYVASGDIDTEVLVEVDLFSAEGVKISIFHAVVESSCKEEF